MLVAENIISEPSPGIYVARPVATMLASTTLPGGFLIHQHENSLAAAKLHDHLASTDYMLPSTSDNGPFQQAYATKKHYFDWLAEQPHSQDAFNKAMVFNDSWRGPPWFTFVPASEMLALRADQTVALVDIGGGVGHDVKQLKAGLPDLDGSVILQDLPHVVADARDMPEGTSTQAHDMFTPQPVHNARAYYLRTVLHDWPDKEAELALRHIAAAMTADSVLLLNEFIMPEYGASLMATRADFVMMTVLAALDRTEAQWKALLERAGFKLVAVHPESGPESPLKSAILEAVLV